MATDAVAWLQGLIAAVPSGENPWLAILAELQSQVEWNLDDSFRIQMWILSGLLVIPPVTLVASLFVRYRQDNLWLIRAMRGQRGTYFVPHYLTTWTLFTAIFLCIIQGFIWKAIAMSDKQHVNTITLWETLTWIPAYVGFWLATSSLVTTHILHLDSSGRPLKSFFASPPFVNAATFLVPVAVIASVTTLAVVAQHKYEDVAELYEPLAVTLTKAAAAYNGTLDTAILAEGMSTGQAFLTDLNSYISHFNNTFYMWLGWMCLLIITFATASALHLGELSKTMDELHNRSQVSEEARSQEEVIYDTYNSLVRITIAIFSIFGTFAAMFLFVAASGSKVVLDMRYLETAHLMPCYAFAILGVPLSIMLFRRALLNGTPPSARPRSRRNSKAHSIGEGGSPLPTTANGGPAGQLESHEMHNIAYSPAGTTSKEDYAAEEYAQPPQQMQAPRMGYVPSPTTSANSGAPFATLAPRPMAPTYTPSPSMPYQARAPAWSPPSSSAGRGSVSSSTGLLGGGGGGGQRSGSRQGLVPAAEPMAEAVPSFYAARSQYS